VAVFSAICGCLVRVAGKGLAGEFTADSLQPTERGGAKEQAERQCPDEEGSRAENAENVGCGKVGRGRIIGNGSMDLDYCQGNSTIIYHSNVRRGSGVDGRSWREFCSLVRREGKNRAMAAFGRGELFLR
jgi:hypothetical protein